jgi:uncharacterized protein
VTTAAPRTLFLNLPVRDLKKSVAFFRTLGFEFDPEFTDERATCLVINDEAFVLLLAEPFTPSVPREPARDTRRQTESICAIAVASRAQVDAITEKALAAGATQALAPRDLGFMYNTRFDDLDGHHWEVLWMDPAALE